MSSEKDELLAEISKKVVPKMRFLMTESLANALAGGRADGLSTEEIRETLISSVGNSDKEIFLLAITLDIPEEIAKKLAKQVCTDLLNEMLG